MLRTSQHVAACDMSGCSVLLCFFFRRIPGDFVSWSRIPASKPSTVCVIVGGNPWRSARGRPWRLRVANPRWVRPAPTLAPGAGPEAPPGVAPPPSLAARSSPPAAACAASTSAGGRGCPRTRAAPPCPRQGVRRRSNLQPPPLSKDRARPTTPPADAMFLD